MTAPRTSTHPTACLYAVILHFGHAHFGHDSKTRFSSYLPIYRYYYLGKWVARSLRYAFPLCSWYNHVIVSHVICAHTDNRQTDRVSFFFSNIDRCIYCYRGRKSWPNIIYRGRKSWPSRISSIVAENRGRKFVVFSIRFFSVWPKCSR